MAKINSTIFKQETIQSWFSGIGTSINNEVIQPFQNAGKVIEKYNLAIQHNSLTQKGWERLLAQSDDSLKAYLTSINGSTASMTGYNVALQGNITGFKKVSSAITQYNALSASGAVEQSTFATAVSTTNGRLGSYLTGLNGAKASLGGYIISLVGATAKTVVLKAATIALNSALTMGVSFIISGVVSAISSYINRAEIMAEKADEARTKIQSLNEELKENQKFISDSAKRYAELVQGVDQLTGKNISLNTDDYEEFLNLSNQLADMFPTLSRNYDENGNAIVQLSGDVDTIVGSLQNLIEAERNLTNKQLAEEIPTIFDDTAEKSRAYEQELSALESKRDALVKSLGDVQSEEFSTNFMDGFANKWIEISGDNLEVISQMRDDYIKIIEDANIDYEELTPTYEMKDGVEVPVGFTIKINSSDEEVEKVKNTIDGKIEDLAKTYAKNIETLNEEINTTNEKNKANWTSLSNSIYAWLSTDDSFKVMDDTMQATVQNIVNSLDWRSLDFSSWEDAKRYIQDNILSLFNTTEGKDILADIQVMFGIQTQFNNGDIPVEQYQSKLQKFLASIESLPPESKKSIMLLFGIQTNEDGTVTSSVDTMIANVEKKLKGTEFDEKVGELNLGDLKIASELEVPMDSIKSWEELLALIQKVKDEVSEGQFSNPLSISETIDQLNTKLKPAMDSLKSAYQDIFTEDGFTRDNIGLDMFSSIKDELDNLQKALDESGSSAIVDYSAYEKLVSVLNDADSSAQQIKDAFDEVALSVANISITGLEDFQVLKESLEQLGYVDADLVAFEALVSNLEALKAAGLDLADTSLTESDFISFVDSLGISAEYATQAVNMLTFAQELNKANSLDTSASVTNLLNLAENAGYTGEIIQWLTKLMEIYRQLESGMLDPHTIQDYVAEAKELTAKIEENAGKINIAPSVDKTDWKPTIKSAGKAGKDAGDAYLEAFEKELSSLKDLRDRGVIDESEYLNRLIQLYTRYFADKKKYLNEYNKYEREYLEGIKSLYDSALSGISKLQDKQIEGYQDAKDSAVESLEAEKEARLDVIEAQKEQLEAQIDLIDEQIEAKEDAIKGIQDEIDAMQEANDERKRQLDIQQKAYNLKRMMNQRTDLLFKDGQMIYREDTKGVRGAKEELDDAILEDKISKKEKEISLIEDEIELLEETKDAIQEQIDALGEQADSIEKHYSKMISSTEKYYDSLIKNAEKQKSKWEELAEIHDVADAYSAIEQVFGDLGYTVEDVLNGSSGAFEDFKTKYIGLINDMNSNSSFAEGLSYATGVAEEDLGSFLDKTEEVSQGLDDLSSKGEGLNTVADAMNKIGTSATTLTTNTEGLDENLSGITDSLTNIPDGAEALSGWVTGFTDLGNAIKGVAEALGLTEENSIGGLVDALQSVSEVSLGGTEDGEGTGIIGQFTALKEAVDSVTSSISGDASGDGSNGGDASGSKSPSMSAGATEGGEGGLIGSIEEMCKKATETLGEGSTEEGSEGEGAGVIGKFAQLKSAVDLVTQAIGTGEEGDEEEGAINLIGALQAHYTKAQTTLPEVKTMFDELLVSIQSCVTALNGMVSAMSSMSGTNLPSVGVGGSVEVNGSANIQGTAKARGDWSVSKSEDSLVGELGQELVVDSRNGTWRTVGDNGAEFTHLNKGDIVFNHKQTKELLKNGYVTGRGKAFANGTDISTIKTPTNLPSYLRPLQEGDRMYDLMKKFDAHNDIIQNQIIPPVNSIQKNAEMMARNISNVNNNNQRSIQVNMGDVICKGVTAQEVAGEIDSALKRELGGMYQSATQMAHTTR